VRLSQGPRNADLNGLGEFMKLLLLVLSASVFTIGCSQPKNRLTDDKNTQFQEKQAKVNKARSNPQTFVIDFQTLEGTHRVPIEATVETDKKKDQAAQRQDQDDEAPTAQASSAKLEQEDDDTKEPVKAPVTESTPVEVVKTEESRDQAVADIAKAADANKAQETQEETQTDEYKLSLEEAGSIVNQVFQLIGNRNAALQAIKAYNIEGSGVSFDKLSFKLDLKAENSAIEILHDNQSLAKFENINAKFGTPVVLESNDISLLAVCANPSCDIRMFTFRKANDEKIFYNLPVFVKIVDGQMIRANLKSDEEYDKESNAKQAQQKATAQQQQTEVQPLDLTEYRSVLEQLSRTQVVKSDEELKQIITLFAAPELKLDPKKIGAAIHISEDSRLDISIGIDKTRITGASKIQLKFGEAFKVQTSEGYNFNAICGNEKCDIIFAAFSKVENKKTVINVPLYYRVLSDSIVRVSTKSTAEYTEDARVILKKENNK